MLLRKTLQSSSQIFDSTRRTKAQIPLFILLFINCEVLVSRAGSLFILIFDRSKKCGPCTHIGTSLTKHLLVVIKLFFDCIY